MRLSSLVEAHVRAILISKKVTREGEVIPYAQTELTVSSSADITGLSLTTITGGD